MSPPSTACSPGCALARGAREHASLEELESIVEYVKAGDFTLAEFLREKLDSDREHKLSVDQFMDRVVRPSRGLKPRRNEFMSKELEQVKTAWLERLKSGVYS